MKNMDFFAAVIVVLLLVVSVEMVGVKPTVIAATIGVLAGSLLAWMSSPQEPPRAKPKGKVDSRNESKPSWVKVSGTRPVGDIEVTLMREGSQTPTPSHVWARKERRDRRMFPPISDLIDDSLANAMAAEMAIGKAHELGLLQFEKDELEIFVDFADELRDRLDHARAGRRERRRHANKNGEDQTKPAVNGRARS